MSDQSSFKLNFCLLFFGTWFVDFLMCDQRIHSPFHWFFGSIQALIYYTVRGIYYAGLISICVAACVIVIRVAFKLHEIYLQARSPAPEAPIKEEFTIYPWPPDLPANGIRQPLQIPASQQFPEIQVEYADPEPAPPPPPKPRKTEEEIMRETLLALKRRY